MVNLIAADARDLGRQSAFPHEIEIEPDLRIPLPDGRKLSARLWLPKSARHMSVPAVIEYAPFRHRDFTYPRDAIVHPWFAGHGYASLRVEPAGSLDSDGAPMDEYVEQEQLDCLHALAWIARQPWCSGATGMFGMSWGAFSALQVAALRPPSLRAIIPVHGTDDRFADDVHYAGGCLLGVNLAWGALYQTYMARPPSRSGDDDAWRAQWKTRIQASPNILEAWVGHQVRDAYWRHGSVREDYDQIEAATLVICGWADGYTNAALRLAEHLTCPNKVWIGPWGHTYPHIAMPGPQAGFLQEATRWWDQWLKNQGPTTRSDQRVNYFMQDTVRPAVSYARRSGRWIAEAAWPSPHVTTQTWRFGETSLLRGEKPPRTAPRTIKTPQANAIAGWEWLPHGVGPEMPLDQREQDSGSLCFDSRPLAHPLEICGRPKVTLRIASDTPKGAICVRLSAIDPTDGVASLITYGLLNLGLRDGPEEVRAMVPGDWADVDVKLNAIAQRVPASHRLRLSVSTQSWPLTWPVAEAMTLSIDPTGSQLDLPLRDLAAPDGLVQTMGPTVLPPNADITWVREVDRQRHITRDLTVDRFTRTYVKDDGAYIVKENNQLVDSHSEIRFRSDNADPLSAEADLNYRLRCGDAESPAEISTRLTVSADADTFFLRGQLIARHEGVEVCRKSLDADVPREAS